MAEALAERADPEVPALARRRGASSPGTERAVAHIDTVELSERAVLGGPAVTVVARSHAGRLEELRRFGLPRLVVVGPNDDAVSSTDALEDWVRLPADDRDVRARLVRLREAARLRAPSPVMDEAGRVIFGGHWVAVSEVEERLTRPLVAAFGRVVRFDELLALGWPGRADRAILRPVMCRLRRRVEPLGIELLSIRDVGYLLQLQPPADR